MYSTMYCCYVVHNFIQQVINWYLEWSIVTTEMYYCATGVPSGMQPSTKLHAPAVADVDVTLGQAADVLAQKASQKKAPLPPRRTTSFRDETHPSPSRFRYLPRAPEASTADDEWHLTVSMSESMDAFSCTTTGESLGGHHRSRSISVDLISSPASRQSHDGSPECGLECRRSPQPASSRDVPYGHDSPGQSIRQKPPETDISDSGARTMPPPPPPRPAVLFDDLSPDATSKPKLGVQRCAIVDQQLLSQLRGSLRKTTATKKPRHKRDDNDDDSGHCSSGGGGVLDKEFDAGCRTGRHETCRDEPAHVEDVGRTTSDSSQISVNGNTSFETRLSESCSNLTEMAVQTPTPKVPRRTEDGPVNIKQSLSDRRPSERILPSEHNCDPSDYSGQPLCITNHITSDGCHTRLELDGITAKLHNRMAIRSHDNGRVDAAELSSHNKISQKIDKPKWKGPRKKLAHDDLEANISAPVFQASSLENELQDPIRKPSNWLENNALSVPDNGGSHPRKIKPQISRPKILVAQVSGRELDGDSSDAATWALSRPPADPAESPDVKPRAKPRKTLETQSKDTDPADSVVGTSSLCMGDLVTKRPDPIGQQSLESKYISNDSQKSPEEPFSGRTLKDGGPDNVKPVLPPGARPVLSGLPGSKPSQMSPLVARRQLSSCAPPLRHVNADEEKVGSLLLAQQPVSKETVAIMTQGLLCSLDVLSSSETRHLSSVLMQLSEEVQLLHRMCCNYVESLAPHGKFQFREILSSLETVTDGLKTSSGSSSKQYDHLLVGLQSCLRAVEGAIKR